MRTFLKWPEYIIGVVSFQGSRLEGVHCSGWILRNSHKKCLLCSREGDRLNVHFRNITKSIGQAVPLGERCAGGGGMGGAGNGGGVGGVASTLPLEGGKILFFTHHAPFHYI